MAASSSSSKIHCYILKKTTQGEKDVTAGLNSNDNGYHKILSLMGIQRTNVEVSRGEFVRPVSTALTAASAQLSQTRKYHIVRDPTITFACPQSDVGPLTLAEHEYLNRTEIVPDRRYQLYEVMMKEPQLLKAPGSVSQPKEKPPSFAPKVGDRVLVPSYGPFGSSYYGVVKWVGHFEGREEKMAGIELEKELKGCSDGITKQGVRYFNCPQDRGVFYSYQSLLPDNREDSETDTQARSMSPLEDTSCEDENKEKARQKYLNEKEMAQQKHLAKTIAAEQQKASGEKTLKQQEYRKKEQLLAGKEQNGISDKMAAKEKAFIDDETCEEIDALKDEIKTLKRQLEQEKRQRQKLEIELAFERKRSLEMEQAASNGPTQAPCLATLTRKTTLNNWRINRKDVMKIRTLGGGAWGLVYEGWYKGQAVAVKEPHLAIMSEDTNKRMEREINIMALVQHPNLVRFIGAVMDEDAQSLKLPPLLVTELMDTDLRSAYMKYDLTSSQLSIFRDVAYALHYLHEHQEPIIHRDVSAPNVLLQQLPNDTWRAKISDFGSANVAKHSKTAAEGAIIYSAPETFPSLDPNKPLAKQTTKIDTFSFGILVCEVITRRQPSPETRHLIIQEVKGVWYGMYDLVIECVREKPEERLTMAEVLRVLNTKSNKR